MPASHVGSPAQGGRGVDSIAQHTRGAIEALVRDLDEVARKEDYRFCDESRTDSEHVAPARAIAFAAGLEGLVDE